MLAVLDNIAPLEGERHYALAANRKDTEDYLAAGAASERTR